MPMEQAQNYKFLLFSTESIINMTVMLDFGRGKGGKEEGRVANSIRSREVAYGGSLTGLMGWW